MNVIIEFNSHSNSDWTPAIEVCEEWMRTALGQVSTDSDYLVSLRFITLEESRELNKTYRKENKPTNVLSFPANFPDNLSENLEYLPLGDIVVCPEIVSSEAKEQGKALEAHWAHMMVHGVLHLCGFVHNNEFEAERMEFHETNTLKKLGFPNPYLIG